VFLRALIGFRRRSSALFDLLRAPALPRRASDPLGELEDAQTRAPSSPDANLETASSVCSRLLADPLDDQRLGRRHLARHAERTRGTVDLACAVSRPPDVQERQGLPGLDAISGSCDQFHAHRVVHCLVGPGSACAERHRHQPELPGVRVRYDAATRGEHRQAARGRGQPSGVVDHAGIPAVRLHHAAKPVERAAARERLFQFLASNVGAPLNTGQTQHLDPERQGELARVLRSFAADKIYGTSFRKWVRDLGIEEVIIAPRSPWQNPYAEHVIGTVRRELLDHVIVLSERHLRRLLPTYVSDYYHTSRTHLSLYKDSPDPRSVEPPELGEVIELPLVGGLHHRYTRRAA
jgi:transposase InsO family protein